MWGSDKVTQHPSYISFATQQMPQTLAGCKSIHYLIGSMDQELGHLLGSVSGSRLPMRLSQAAIWSLGFI